MTRPMSRAQRAEAFLQEARKMYDALEEWYDACPEASFGQIEGEARQRRRELRRLCLLYNAGIEVQNDSQPISD